MTTHVFIVDENTFKYHLEYLFVGTGGKEYNVDLIGRILPYIILQRICLLE